jgi:hypothetical protein
MVCKEEGENFAKQLNISFFECSVKQDINVDLIFESFFNQVCNRIIREKIKYEENININQKAPIKNKCC